VFLLQKVSVFPLIFHMGFIHIWVGTFWVWFCEGFYCQFLAKKGENGIADKGVVNQESLYFQRNYKDVAKNVVFQQELLCLCDLCPEL